MTEQEIIDRLVLVFQNREGVLVGRVKDVEATSCKVAPISGGEDIPGVKYVVEESGVTYTPKEGALVLVAIDRINKIQCKYYLIMCNKYTSIQIAVDGASNLYSMAKTELLIEELNKTNAVVNALKNVLLNFAPVAGDGGAALKTFATTQVGALAVGSYAAIKNENVKHG
jgi:hypothetical protein